MDGSRPLRYAATVYRTVPLVFLLLGCRSRIEPRAEWDGRDAVQGYSWMLQRVVTADGYVDYDKLEENREPLDQYVAFIAEQRPQKVSQAKHAFWLNTYNALVLTEVLEYGRPASVLDVPGWVPKPGSGFFMETAFQVNEDEVSLFEIEHERVRQRLLDVRDHAAMNCASRSCPPLRDEAYDHDRLAQQLNDQMRRWINDPNRGVRIEGGVAVFNPIFEWYAQDFWFWTAGENLCAIGAIFAERPLAEELDKLAKIDCPHRFFEYDWRLNDAKAVEAERKAAGPK